MGGGVGRRTPQGKLNHGGRWRFENEWPPARTKYTDFFLHSDGSLSTQPSTSNSPAKSYTFDPRHPVPTLGGSMCGIMETSESTDLDQAWRRLASPMQRLKHIVATGPVHQQEAANVFGAQPPYPLLADRADVLAFATPPLTGPIEVTGSCVVELWVSSSAVDTDFTAKLVDVYPPSADYPGGYHMNLVDSIIRARFRNGWEREEFMTPDEVYRVRIELPPTSNLFAAGHRIRLDISSSNFPRFDINPNTGEPMGRHTRMIPAETTVYLDSERPSRVTLPVMPT
jgi:predicted acyl esterase